MEFKDAHIHIVLKTSTAYIQTYVCVILNHLLFFPYHSTI